MSFEIGNRIFDYEITGVLGAGGMGKVYKVRNVISDRVDAMKILLPDLAHQPELADRFLREIKVLASLNHPNIAAFHTALTYENQLIMVMEFVSGITLNERLQQGPLPLKQAITCIDQALAALGYAHRQGVIHRDIKPANMMLTPEGGLKLMDFGIAKAATDPHLTRTGTTVGSLFYISPEQLSGGALDARSDLYSLGIAMYEIVTGKRPFEGKSEYSLMAAHLNEAPRPPMEMNPALSPALSSVILLALAKNPDERFQSADAFRTALTEATRGLEATTVPVVATPPPAELTRHSPANQPSHLNLTGSQHPGHRGLYMLLGALIAIVFIVASAVELPRWFRARAHTQGAVPAALNAPQGAPAQSQAQAATPPPVATPPASNKSTGSGATTPSSSLSAPAGPSSSRALSMAAHHPAAAQAAPHSAAPLPASEHSGESKDQALRAKATQQESQHMTSEISPAPPADAAELQTLSDHMDRLSARASAIKATFSGFQQQVGSSTGQSLRPDIIATENRMERYMDEADSALAAHNGAQARHYQELAEREIVSLEKFFGR
ncbi:MAG TPA: serine/threonine-protein kinase [Terriglobia bacterium]|nr:serine/threonine-protein kinase [Terriglobia bacterium]